jgi:uncharacterized phage infection (PIP) family protein YhgE
MYERIRCNIWCENATTGRQQQQKEKNESQDAQMFQYHHTPVARVNNQYEEGSTDIQRRTRTTETHSQTTTRKIMSSRSFGEYFDDQRDRIVAAMKNKNTQLDNEWRERYDERENAKKKKHEKFKKELDECSDKGVEISQECKEYFKKRFEWGRRNP